MTKEQQNFEQLKENAFSIALRGAYIYPTTHKQLIDDIVTTCLVVKMAIREIFEDESKAYEFCLHLIENVLKSKRTSIRANQPIYCTIGSYNGKLSQPCADALVSADLVKCHEDINIKIIKRIPSIAVNISNY